MNPWSEMAWTYQETVLSLRLMVFTNICIHFACDNATWSEDLYKSTSFRLGTVFAFRTVLTMSGDGPHPLIYGTPLVKHLSSRNLTYDADILYAAAGLLGLLEKVYGEASIYGLPESCIEYCLYWIPDGYRLRCRRTD